MTTIKIVVIMDDEIRKEARKWCRKNLEVDTWFLYHTSLIFFNEENAVEVSLRFL